MDLLTETQKTVTKSNNGTRDSGSNDYNRKEFASDQDVRWCPGCGDYTILKQVQSTMPDIGVDKENIVFISGIGCAARFPYYMDTFGMHSIHGRAPAIATGLKVTRPELSVWIITGDGDSLSIGANHFAQILRRNVDVNMLLFNNEIYGLTKGQYSPTSHEGAVTKSTPVGSIDHPFNPLAFAMGSDGSFIARVMDRDPRHMQSILKRAHEHKGTSMVEIYQNCIVFNDGAFEIFTDKKTRPSEAIYLEHGKPLIFGQDKNKGVRLDGYKPEVVSLENYSKDDLWIHDEKNKEKAGMLTRFFDNVNDVHRMPRPFGVIYDVDRPCYEEGVNAQVEKEIATRGKGNLDELLRGPETWDIV